MDVDLSGFSGFSCLSGLSGLSGLSDLSDLVLCVLDRVGVVCEVDIAAGLKKSSTCTLVAISSRSIALDGGGTTRVGGFVFARLGRALFRCVKAEIASTLGKSVSSSSVLDTVQNQHKVELG